MRLFLILLALLFTTMAEAAPPMGRITATTATSTCIGNANNATCAAETLLACFARADANLCKRVGINDPGNELAAGARTIEYVIDRQSTIKKEDITDDVRDLDYFKPGYVLLEIRRRDCPAGQATCQDVEWADLQVYAKPAASGGWEIAAWRGNDPDDQESAPEIPDSYQPPKSN